MKYTLPLEYIYGACWIYNPGNSFNLILDRIIRNKKKLSYAPLNPDDSKEIEYEGKFYGLYEELPLLN